MEQKGAGFAIASMVLGIVALLSSCTWFIGIPCAIIGLILGSVSLKGQRKSKGMAIAGVVTSIIALVPAVIILVTGASLMAAFGL